MITYESFRKQILLKGYAFNTSSMEKWCCMHNMITASVQLTKLDLDPHQRTSQFLCLLCIAHSSLMTYSETEFARQNLCSGYLPKVWQQVHIARGSVPLQVLCWLMIWLQPEKGKKWNAWGIFGWKFLFKNGFWTILGIC